MKNGMKMYIITVTSYDRHDVSNRRQLDYFVQQLVLANIEKTTKAFITGPL